MYIYIYTEYRERESIFIAAYLNQNYLKGMMIQIHNHAIPTKINPSPNWGSGSDDFPLHKMIGWGLITVGVDWLPSGNLT